MRTDKNPHLVSPRHKPKREVGVSNTRYSDAQKLDAVKTYLMLGNATLTAATLKIPLITLNWWRKSEWWNQLVNELRREDSLVLSERMKKVVDKAWTAVEDRIENGDWIYDQKTGALKRKPVTLKDASKVAIDAATLRQKLELTEHYTVDASQIDNKLDQLAKAMKDLARGVVNQETAVDVEYVETQWDSDNASNARQHGSAVHGPESDEAELDENVDRTTGGL
jgi:hypothetical protein